jgi:hypothetical protein
MTLKYPGRVEGLGRGNGRSGASKASPLGTTSAKMLLKGPLKR